MVCWKGTRSQRLQKWSCMSHLVPFAALLAQLSPTNIFAPDSTSSDYLYDVTLLVLAVTGAIFLVVGGMLVYVAVKYRSRLGESSEPIQVYGSKQLELAWTVLPVLIVMVLFLSSARVIHAVQDAPKPKDAIEVIVVGHQFWWEYRYPQYGIVTANELHIPVSEAQHPTPTFMTLLSADTDHDYWVPRLSGNVNLIPNHPNSLWMDPHETGLYLGQCNEYCGTSHAKMLLRVYVQTREEFDRWVNAQRQTNLSPESLSGEATEGRKVFEHTACINCHAIAGTIADGRFGPELRHLMSRETIAAGIAPNTAQNIRTWIQNPNALKPGARMPAMGLSDQELDEVTAYMMALH